MFYKMTSSSTMIKMWSSFTSFAILLYITLYTYYSLSVWILILSRQYRLFLLPQQLWWLTLDKPWVTYLFCTGGLSAPVSGVGGGTDRLTLTQLSQQRSTTSGECSFDLELGASATKVNQRLQEKQRDTAAANRKQYNKLQAIHRIAAGQ